MARMVKVGNEAREKYSYFAYPKKLDRTLQRIVIEEAGKYGIENVKDLMKNIFMEAVTHYEKAHRYIEAREWASENWQKNGFSDMTATNIDEKLKSEDQKLAEEEERLKQVIESAKQACNAIKRKRFNVK
jgi:predicted GNAT family N-acyltransferase